MKLDTILLYCNLIISVAMGTFAFDTFQEGKIFLTLIFAAVSLVMFTVVLLTFMNNRKLKAKKINK